MSTEYDAWKLASPPEAEEEDMEVSCDGVLTIEMTHQGVVVKEWEIPCQFEGKVTAMVDAHRYYWSCPRCDSDYVVEWAE